MLRNTIKPTFEYIVYKSYDNINKKDMLVLFDGEILIMYAYKATREQYEDEAKNNEAFHKCEVFTSRKGKQYIYWRDEEADIDYLTPLERASDYVK